MNNEEIAIKLTEHHKEIGSLKHRVDKCEQQTEVLNKLTSSIDTLALNMKFMADEQKKQGQKLERLETESTNDLKDYKKIIVSCVLTTIVGAIVGALISLIFGGA